MRLEFEDEGYLRGCIRSCQEEGHVQQVAFSTYHNALTQICFTCSAVRTSIDGQWTKKLRENKKLREVSEPIGSD